MSLDGRLRAGLERSSRGIEERELDTVLIGLVKRAHRRKVVRRVIAAGIVLVAIVAVIVLAPKALDALRSAQNRKVPAGPRGMGVITTVIGNGKPGSSGDGGPAKDARLNYPVDLAFDGDGNLYVLDLGNPSNPGRVRKVDRSGRITTVVGPGAVGEAGGAVLGVTFGATGLAVDAQGNVYVAGGDGNFTDHRVIRVDPSGNVTTVAGTGVAGHSGDGGPATQAELGVAWDVAVDLSGNLYISVGNQIRRVDTSGVITTIAGTGERGFSGDGGPAGSAQLDHVTGVAVDAADNLYLIDEGNGRIRRIDADGIITTIAGNGETGYSGDGGLATEARLNAPEHLWVDAEGNVFIADSYNRRVRKVGVDGIITTVAGNGSQSFSGDGGPAMRAGLSKISGVAIGPDGVLYVADSGHNRIRRVVL
jgi:sugar lactone lactonase YvrE